MGTAAGNYQHLIQKIDEFIRKYYLNKVVKGSIYLAAILFAAYLLITTAEYFGNFSPAVRTFLFYAFVSGLVTVASVYIVFPLMAYFRLGKTISHLQASEIIGDHFAPVKDKLLNTLQLKKLSEENPTHLQLIEASISQKISELRPVPFSSAVKIGENRRYLKYALAPLALIIGIFLMAPSMLRETTVRLIDHDRRFVKKAPFQFVIVNKSLSAVQGEDYELRIKLTGNEIPNDIYLEDGQNTFKLEKESITKFKYTFRNIQSDRKIALNGGGYSSGDYVIGVRKKPVLLNFDVRLDYPAYLNKPGETISNSGDLTVPAGTRISWKFNSSNTNSLDLAFPGKTFRLSPSGNNRFSFSYRALRDAAYTVRPMNAEINNTEAVSYRLSVVPDLAPAIDISEKRDSVNSNVLYFIGQVTDDHGFSKLTFNYRILSGDKPAKGLFFSKQLAFDKSAIQSNFFHTWNTKELKARQGQEIEYYFEIFDNDGVLGPKRTKSGVKMLKVPTAAEIEEKLDAGSEAVKQKMEDAIRQAARLEKDAKKISQDLLNKKTLTFEEKKQVEQLLQKQKDLEALVKDIQKDNKQNLFDKQENQEQRKEILEKQKQIEDLFNNVLDEKTRELLKNIQKLLEQNNKNLTKEELSRVQTDNKTLQKELDRILELYKQLEFDQKLAENIDKLKDLSKEQEELANKTDQKNSDFVQLKKEQDELKKDFDNIQKNLGELEKKNEELEKKNDFSSQEKEQEQIAQKQEQSSKNLENKNRKKASENQKQAAQQMKQLSEKLEEMQQENEQEENEVNSQSLRSILNDLLTTSFDQEKVMQDLRNTNTSDPGYVLQAQKQRGIKDNLKTIQDSLYSLSKKVPQIQSVVNKEIEAINFNVDKALESLGERRTSEANKNQQYAMTSINNLALMLSEAMDQLQKSQKNSKSGKSGKKQSLSQLSKMQQQLNKNMQKAREQMQQEGQEGKQGQGKDGKPQSGQGKGQMSEQLAKMAREQQMIRQAMQEINRDMNKDGQGSLGDLDKLSKEMEQTETDLVNKNIRRETLNRQQEILSKLLEAEKAERERDEDKQRESKQGLDKAPDFKSNFKDYEKLRQRETELIRTLPPALNSFYKNRVNEYFKSLNSEKNK